MKKAITIPISLFCLMFITVLLISSNGIREPVGQAFKKVALIFSVYQRLKWYPQSGIQNVMDSVQQTEIPIDTITKKESPGKKIIIKDVALKQISFLDLPGWNNTDIKKSLSVFQNSCKKFLTQEPDQPGGSKYIDLRARDWQSPCKVALSIEPITDKSAKKFFENWFAPIEFKKNKPISGKFTGYYMPVIKGNLTKSKQYNIPIYGGSSNRDSKKNKNTQKPVLAWIKSSRERLFLKIEGAGIIQLTDGKRLYISYEGRKAELLNQQDSLGTRGTVLTPGYSLAIDKNWIPLGSPLWLSTAKPITHENNENPLSRLMIAQDTGNAIRGVMRGDVYWGEGEKATFLGKNMMNEGRYWLLLPKQAIARLFPEDEFNSFTI